MKKHHYLLALSAIVLTGLAACGPKKDNNSAISVNNSLLKDTISDTTARRLVKNFDGRANHFKKGELIMPDTRCVWFSVKQLKSLVTRIENEGGDGVRFYLAAYDKTSRPDLHKIDSTYLDYTTLVMVSTRDSLGLHFDYYHSPKAKNGKGVILTTNPENQGELCPPPITCASIGATLLK